jgi:hypothetical protein
MSRVVQLFPSKHALEGIKPQTAANGMVVKLAESSTKLDSVMRGLLASLDALDRSIDDVCNDDARWELRKSTKHQREALVTAAFALTAEVKRLSSHSVPALEACGLPNALRARDARA